MKIISPIFYYFFQLWWIMTTLIYKDENDMSNIYFVGNNDNNFMTLHVRCSGVCVNDDMFYNKYANVCA